MIKTQLWGQAVFIGNGGENTKNKITIIIIKQKETDGGGGWGRGEQRCRGLMVGQSGWGEVCVGVCLCMLCSVWRCVCVSMWQKLGGIERALTLCLYGPTVNGDKGPARSTAQPDDVTAHVPGQLGEAGGLQQESLLGLHGGFGAVAVSHRHHVVWLAGSVTPWARLLRSREGQKGRKKQTNKTKENLINLTSGRKCKSQRWFNKSNGF